MQGVAQVNRAVNVMMLKVLTADCNMSPTRAMLPRQHGMHACSVVTVCTWEHSAPTYLGRVDTQGMCRRGDCSVHGLLHRVHARHCRGYNQEQYRCGACHRRKRVLSWMGDDMLNIVALFVCGCTSAHWSRPFVNAC